MSTPLHILFFLFASLVFSQNEIDIKNLKPIENIYFAKNSKKPFSGSAFSFSKLTQKKILEFQIIDGMKNGTYEEWYINGKKKSKYNYQDNLKHGRYTTYYQNGKKKEKGFWKHGNNEGLCSFWFENGQQKKKGFIKIPKGLVFGPIGTRMEISSVKDTEIME